MNSIQGTAKSRATKGRILEVARGLFNEHGTAAVSTNRIAEESRISPGNLYYHYADKRAIIRDLLAAYVEEHAKDWGADSDRGPVPTWPWLRETILRGAELAWQYRFIGRELVALLRADPELARMYRRNHEERLAQWEAFGEQLVSARVLVRPDSLTNLITIIWLISESWLTQLEVTGHAHDEGAFARQVDLILTVLDPYLTATTLDTWASGAFDAG